MTTVHVHSTHQPRSRPMETVQTTVMEPLVDGTFAEHDVTKHAHQCLGCGLVWAIKWHADTCADRDHVAHWQQRYVSGPIVNGQPTYERFYDRDALRRAPLPNTSANAPTTREPVKSGTYTIVNPKTGGYRTVKIEDPNPEYWRNLTPGMRIASYLSGPDNDTSFTGVGFVTPTGELRMWKSFANKVPDIQAALRWLLAHGAGREVDLAKAYALISGRCGFCGHKLTTPESLAAGYGPVCADKNDLPWGGKHVAPAKIGFQTVKPLRTYDELFRED